MRQVVLQRSMNLRDEFITKALLYTKHMYVWLVTRGSTDILLVWQRLTLLTSCATRKGSVLSIKDLCLAQL